MKRIKLKFKLNKKSFKKAANLVLEQKRLFFILFCGALLVYTFNIIYQNVYFKINYHSYSVEDNFTAEERRIRDVMIKRVMKDIEKRKEERSKGVEKIYKNPFRFEHSVKEYPTEKNPTVGGGDEKSKAASNYKSRIFEAETGKQPPSY